ncbi:MAG: glycosyltransferase family 39 protein, partial [Parvularculaceae bacterium]|nr:glycosyltransferase family 39 protein [Parvularculaceae bacterium]
RFQNEERNKKPVGIHWLQAASVAATSAPEKREIFAYRLPSALAVAIAAFFVSSIARRLFDARTGALAGLLFATMPLVVSEGVIAKTDAALLAAVVVAASALADIVMRTAKGDRVPFGPPLLFWTALGVGILIKGPIAPLIFILTIISIALATRSARLLRAIRPASGVVVTALIVAPWLFAINHSTDGRFFAEALGRDMIGKIGTAQESHGGPPGFHLALASLLLWPAAALLPSGIAAAWRQRRETPFLFLLCWAAPTWIVFELTSTKLPHYVLPLYPALAILAARAATEPSALPWPRTIGAALFALCGVLFAVAVIALPIAYGNGVDAATSLLGAAIGVGAIALAFQFRRGASMRSGAGAIALSAATILTLFLAVAPRLEALDVSRRMSAALEAERLHPIRNDAPPAFIAGYSEPSAIFLL